MPPIKIEGSENTMKASNGRGSLRPSGRSPPFLLIGLSVALCIIGFNYWSVSSRNSELLGQITILKRELQNQATMRMNADKRIEEVGTRANKYLEEKSKCMTDRRLIQDNADECVESSKACEADRTGLNERLQQLESDLKEEQKKNIQSEKKCDLNSCLQPIGNIINILTNSIGKDAVRNPLIQNGIDVTALFKDLVGSNSMQGNLEKTKQDGLPEGFNQTKFNFMPNKQQAGQELDQDQQGQHEQQRQKQASQGQLPASHGQQLGQQEHQGQQPGQQQASQGQQLGQQQASQGQQHGQQEQQGQQPGQQQASQGQQLGQQEQQGQQPGQQQASQGQQPGQQEQQGQQPGPQSEQQQASQKQEQAQQLLQDLKQQLGQEPGQQQPGQQQQGKEPGQQQERQQQAGQEPGQQQQAGQEPGQQQQAGEQRAGQESGQSGSLKLGQQLPGLPDNLPNVTSNKTTSGDVKVKNEESPVKSQTEMANDVKTTPLPEQNLEVKNQINKPEPKDNTDKQVPDQFVFKNLDKSQTNFNSANEIGFGPRHQIVKPFEQKTDKDYSYDMKDDEPGQETKDQPNVVIEENSIDKLKKQLEEEGH